MTLGQVLEGDFFTQYIKIGMHYQFFFTLLLAWSLDANIYLLGNIMMLSEGKVAINNVFSIKDGTSYLPC